MDTDINYYVELLNELKTKYGEEFEYEKLTNDDKVAFKECLWQLKLYFDAFINRIDEWEGIYGKAEDSLVLQ